MTRGRLLTETLRRWRPLTAHMGMVLHIRHREFGRTLCLGWFSEGKFTHQFIVSLRKGGS